MDAVITGIIGGSGAALLVIFGGFVTKYNWDNIVDKNSFMFYWIMLLSALTVFQSYLVFTISMVLSESPRLGAEATPQ
jgi:hypothetical protein